MHTHTCHFCPKTGEGEDRTRLPSRDWRWMTRRKEGLNAVAVCPSCAPKKLPEVMLRRVGGPAGRGGQRRAIR